MAVFAPHANSYRRFRAMSYAPVAPTWGVNNRSVSLRIPAGPPASRHVEHRVAGADANPYLVAALVLGAHAARHRGPHRSGPAGRPATATSRRRAANCRRTGTRRSIGPRGRSSSPGRWARNSSTVFLAIKRRECEKFGALVSDRDYEWYLDSA